MPIYEYHCKACGHEFDILQKISDAALTECPECGRKALQKLVSAAGFRLKGGGWYETDFKQGKRRNMAEAGDKGSAEKPAAETTAKSTSADKPAKSAKAEKTAAKADGAKGTT